ETPLKQATQRRMKTLAPYIVKRSIKLLKLLSKMHEDVQFDFREDFEQLAELMANIPLIDSWAAELGLDLNKMRELDLTDFQS
ncbi:MAG: hypothetical protein AAFV07_15120, partial [Bacteroidota bacterium]